MQALIHRFALTCAEDPGSDLSSHWRRFDCALRTVQWFTIQSSRRVPSNPLRMAALRPAPWSDGIGL